MKKEDAAWLAGLLEGEAWFGERRGEGRTPRPMIALKMTDRDVVERVAEMFGGKAVTKIRMEAQKDQYVVRLVGPKTIEIMETVLPWMGKRRTETIEMLLWLYKDAPRRKLTCECGQCPKCRNRQAQRVCRERKAAA